MELTVEVYGLREAPFEKGGSPCERAFGRTVCKYRFIAPTSDIRNAQSYLVRDLTLHHMNHRGTIRFAPSFASVTISSLYPVNVPAAAGRAGPMAVATPPPPNSFFSISGFDFGKLRRCDEAHDSEHPCLRVFVGIRQQQPEDTQFAIQSDNIATAFFTASMLGKAKAIRLQLDGGADAQRYPRVEWALLIPKSDDAKPLPTPSFLKVGDCGKVSFPGANLATVDKVTFEDQTLASHYNQDSSALEVIVTTSVTKLSGHKEFTASVSGRNVAQLQIDVMRQ